MHKEAGSTEVLCSLQAHRERFPPPCSLAQRNSLILLCRGQAGCESARTIPRLQGTCVGAPPACPWLPMGARGDSRDSGEQDRAVPGCRQLKTLQKAEGEGSSGLVGK